MNLLLANFARVKRIMETEKRDEDDAWYQVSGAMRMARYMQTPQKTLGSLICDADILQAARDCKHRPDGVRCRMCKKALQEVRTVSTHDIKCIQT